MTGVQTCALPISAEDQNAVVADLHELVAVVVEFREVLLERLDEHLQARHARQHPISQLMREPRLEVGRHHVTELGEALGTDTDRIMLDDFTLDDVRRAVELRNAQPGKRKELEVSGGVSADGLAAIGATGVDYVSVGALTKHVRAIDFSMRFV